jgi:hypothetical protein
MPICIRHADRKGASTQQAHVSAFECDAIPFLVVFYMALQALAGVLCGPT